MQLRAGIIGLPNVGKSSVFNALSGASVSAENYPFCTIDANRAMVKVPDEKIQKLGELLNKPEPVPSKVEFVDIAGLVKGASKGEGLGNRFLEAIRNVDALLHVVRCFDHDDVSHVEGSVDPVRDIEIINTELILSDIEILERALDKNNRLANSGDKLARERVTSISSIIEKLNQGTLLRDMSLQEKEKTALKELDCITGKPELYVANVSETSENRYLDELSNRCREKGAIYITLDAGIESELMELEAAERKEYMEELGIKSSGLDRLIEQSYRLLGLISYYTTATELQAWPIVKGTTAVEAAGMIHTDFARGFIRAETFSSDDLLAAGSEIRLKEEGKIRSEGRDYIIREGDVIRFLFNV